VKKACELTGRSRATVYRRRNRTRSGCRERRPAPANALSAGEREELLAVLDSPRFADKAPRQVWALLIDEGVYLASVSTMYRLLREAGRSASAARKPPTRPARNPSSSPARPMKCGPGHYQAGGPAPWRVLPLVRDDRYFLPVRRAFRGARHGTG